ncbi:MAG: hypothetical protein R3F25_13000 [Gammaproteobacteria bacterium]
MEFISASPNDSVIYYMTFGSLALAKVVLGTQRSHRRHGVAQSFFIYKPTYVPNRHTCVGRYLNNFISRSNAQRWSI